MTFWKKFQGVQQKQSENLSVKLANLYSNNTSLNVNHELIGINDEKPYLNDHCDASEDPLLESSQIVQKFDKLLKDCFQFPYFIEFLESCDILHLSKCWSECDKFRALSSSICIPSNADETITNCDNQPINIIGSYSYRKTSKLKQNTKSDKSSYNSDGCENNCSTNALPDLVSNINSTTPVTPLPSPEEDNVSPNENVSSEILLSDTFRNCEDFVPKRENDSNLPAQIEVSLSENVENFEALPQRSSDNLEEVLNELALKIYNKYIDDNGSHAISILQQFSETLFSSIKCGNLNPDLFLTVQDALYSLLETEYFPKYMESEYFLKHKIEVFTSQEVFLQDVLSCDAAFPYFMEYLEQENAQSLLEFWISISNFKSHLEEQRSKHLFNFQQAQSDAMILYDKYFSLQATHKLGFSDKVRFLVECSICQDEGTSINCFDVPLRIVLSILQRDFLPGYISSSLHIKFISELINTMKVTSRVRRRTISGSTCLSEDSKSSNIISGKVSTAVSQRNTLLAMDSSKSGGAKIVKSDPTFSMRIDSKQILDPDSLWRRKNFTKLSCGFVDELGRFESDLQPEPGGKIESKFSKTLRRFAKREEDKVKQDMAYKVAEMIIKDVTNVTLSPTNEHVRPKLGRRPLSCYSFDVHDSSLPKLSHASSMPRSLSEITDLNLSSSLCENEK